MPAAIIYATNSRLLRRVVVSSTDKELQGALAVLPGESLLLMTSKEYAKHNAASLVATVVAAIGDPVHSGRCVEVNTNGQCVAVYAADPELDQPRDAANTLEVHDTADVGDVKLAATGEFVSMKPLPTKDQLSLNAQAYAAAFGAPISKAQADTLADAEVAKTADVAAKQIQAADQIKP